MNLQKEIQEPGSLPSPKHSHRHSDFFQSVRGDHNFDFFYSLEHNQTQGQFLRQEKDSISINLQDENLYYNALFSPSTVASSIIKRNQSLQIQCLQNSISLNFEDDQGQACQNQGGDKPENKIYKKRIKRVNKLQEKQKTQIDILSDIKKTDFEKYKSILQFLKIFYILKKYISGVRNDYYSNKTFSAIKNTPSQTLTKAFQVLWNMIQNIRKIPKISKNEMTIDYRMVEFMIIPRFLISKKKIKEFAENEELQDNIGILISYECFGHYNNESNKKFPSKKQMDLFNGLIVQKKGKERYKKITSINHGGKFIKQYPTQYSQLFDKSLQYLNVLDHGLKIGKKYDQLKSTLENMQQKISQQKNQSFFQTEQKRKIQFNFEINREDPKSLGDYLIMLDHHERLQQIDVPLKKSQSCSFYLNEDKGFGKSKLKKLMSLPTSESEPKKSFGIKKSFTMQVQQNQFMEKSNIILVPPPEEPDQD